MTVSHVRPAPATRRSTGLRGALARRGRSSLLAACCVLLAGLLSPAAAAAHTDLSDTSPADGAVLRKPPERVVLTFTQPPLDQGMAVRVMGPSGSFPLQPGANGNRVTAPWPAAEKSGQYRVDYRVVATDGHPIEGTLRFRVRGENNAPGATEAAAPATEPEPADPTAPGSLPPWLWLAGAVVLVTAVLLILQLRRSDQDR